LQKLARIQPSHRRIYAEFYSTSTGESSLTVGLMLLIIGEASLAGIVTVGVQLRLDAIYRSDGTLEGTGTLSFRVKICWCFTLSVTESAHYVLNRGSGTQTKKGDRKQRIGRDFT
jgi:hypothetical protein